MTLQVPKFLGDCLLRDFVEQDAEPLADIEYDPVVKKYFGDGPLKGPRVDWVRKVASDPEALRGWAIEALPERVVAGRASISRPSVPAKPGTLELQIVIATPYWGRGLGRRVATALIQYAFSDKRVVAVVAAAHPENQASLALLDAFNFVGTGLKDKNEHLIYELTRPMCSLLVDADAERVD
jgi:RimJ/RimL family protein N-acetyltransferase